MGYIDSFVSDVITHPCPNFNSGLNKPLWMGNHIALFYLVVTTFPYPNPDASLVNISRLNGPMGLLLLKSINFNPSMHK